MLIGLWSAEPQQIKSSEQIMAWADIKPLPYSQTHILTRKESGEGEREGLVGE